MLFLINKEGCTPLCMAINEMQDAKALTLIDKMERFGVHHSPLRFVKRPNRLELKFEKPFTLSVLKNNFTLIQAFPEKSIRTCYVYMGQTLDYRKFKQDKLTNPEVITTPFHLACKLSNDEAVRQLVDQHSYDVNILINNKSALHELLSTSCYLDFNILNFLLKKRKPNINSGNKLPLNQAILRGNPFIIKSLIEFGRPHPMIRDSQGKASIHIAAVKLDMDSFDALVQAGADPMMPDSEGNTILHMLTLGVIRDAEYDFIKQSIIKYNLRLTRNNENRTPLSIIRSYSTKAPALRGQPNFKKKILEYFEERIRLDEHFQDAD
jgi:ankyrin repeat protein